MKRLSRKVASFRVEKYTEKLPQHEFLQKGEPDQVFLIR